MTKLRVKVCGMAHSDNIRDIAGLEVDYIGLIFFEKSSRFVKDLELPDIPGIQKIGVFVNESVDVIRTYIRKYGLNGIQLHGEESPEDCKAVKKLGVEVFKAVSVDSNFNFESLRSYGRDVDYFIFDAKGPKRGGNGIPFDWKKLSEYKDDIPFFLSGGIGPEMVGEIGALDHPMLYAVDINSRFEIEPGLKNVENVKQFIKELKQYQ